jgi:hypothetical protein
MTSKAEVAKVMEQVFKELDALREAGQKEYAGGGDNAFGNFERLQAEVDVDKKKVLWIYAMKHKDGIAAFLRGHNSQREPVEGRINDLIVYLILLRAMIEEDKKSEVHVANGKPDVSKLLAKK